MPTLLSINNYYYARGGAEVVFLEQNRLFQATGWDVIPFAMQHPQNLETPWSAYFVEEIEFSREYSPWGKLRRMPKVIYSLEARKKLGQLCDRIRADICHIHNMYHHISPSILGVLKRRGIPTALTLHDLKLACPAYKMLTEGVICERCKGGALSNVIKHRCIKESLALSAVAYLETRLHRVLKTYDENVDRLIVPSRFYLEKFTEWGFAREKFVYIPNLVDIKRLRPTKSVGKTFLYFGRLGPEKGLATLLRAATQAAVPLQIAGTGSEEERLKALASELGVNVAFLGYLSGTDLHSVIQQARAVVLPSEWYENAPMSVLESYALGVPVVGADIGGIGELVRTGETGATFQSGSVEALASKLRWFADLPDQAVQEMGDAGRRWVEAEFSGERYRERLLGLYQDMGYRPS